MRIINSCSVRVLKGFTLVEMLVYLAIFFVVTTASTTFLLSLNNLISQYKVETMLYKSGANALEQVVLSIRQADQVNITNSTFNSPATGRLMVESTASSTSFALNSGSLTMSVNGINLGNVISEGVTVTGFTVYRYPLTVGELVRVKLRLSATTGSITKDITLYGGSIIRGAI